VAIISYSGHIAHWCDIVEAVCVAPLVARATSNSLFGQKRAAAGADGGYRDQTTDYLHVLPEERGEIPL
jgi:hypothetical protein